MAIPEATIDFAVGNVHIVAGGNGVGKSTLTQHLFEVLKGNVPSVPLKKGALAGFYKVVLDDAEAYIRLDEDQSTFELKQPSGKAMSQAATKEWIRRVCGDQSGVFDIDAFLSETQPKVRKAMLQKLANVDVDAHDLAVKNTHDTRKEAKRKLAEQEVRVKDYDPSIAGKELVDVGALLAERNRLAGLNQERNALTQDLNFKHQAEERKRDEKADIDRDIERLKAQLKEAEERATAKQIEVNAAVEAVKTAQAKLDAAKPADPNEVLRIDQELTNASQTNADINKHKGMEQDVRQLKELRTAVETSEQAVKDAEQARVNAIASVPLPEGLKFTSDGQDLLLNDLPLDQACKSELTILSIKLQSMHLGELKYIAFDGSHLDHANLSKVVQWIQDNGYQAAIEIAERAKDAQGLHVVVAEQYLA